MVKIVKGSDGFYVAQAMKPGVQLKVNKIMTWDKIPGSEIEIMQNSQFLIIDHCFKGLSKWSVDFTVGGKLYAREYYPTVAECENRARLINFQWKKIKVLSFIRVFKGSDNKTNFVKVLDDL